MTPEKIYLYIINGLMVVVSTMIMFYANNINNNLGKINSTLEGLLKTTAGHEKMIEANHQRINNLEKLHIK